MCAINFISLIWDILVFPWGANLCEFTLINSLQNKIHYEYTNKFTPQDISSHLITYTAMTFQYHPILPSSSGIPVEIILNWVGLVHTTNTFKIQIWEMWPIAHNHGFCKQNHNKLICQDFKSVLLLEILSVSRGCRKVLKCISQLVWKSLSANFQMHTSLCLEIFTLGCFLIEPFLVHILQKHTNTT